MIIFQIQASSVMKKGLDCIIHGQQISKH